MDDKQVLFQILNFESTVAYSSDVPFPVPPPPPTLRPIAEPIIKSVMSFPSVEFWKFNKIIPCR